MLYTVGDDALDTVSDDVVVLLPRSVYSLFERFRSDIFLVADTFLRMRNSARPSFQNLRGCEESGSTLCSLLLGIGGNVIKLPY